MYRPKGWVNPYDDKVDEWVHFEAGADAMLEGLRKRAFMMVSCGQKIGYYPTRPSYGENGHLVFIPEEE